MYVHVGDIHRVTPCVIVRYTDYVCKTQNLFYELTLYFFICASKKMQKSSAIQKISVILSSVNISAIL